MIPENEIEKKNRQGTYIPKMNPVTKIDHRTRKREEELLLIIIVIHF